MKAIVKFSILALLLAVVSPVALTSCGEAENVFGTHTHTYGDWTVVTNATCTVEGKEERSCSCGEIESRSIAKLAHVEVTLPAVEPTCSLPGQAEGKGCSVCDAVLVEQETISALGHSYGLESHTCTTCQSKLSEISNVNDFNAYQGLRDAVIFLDKCVDTSNQSTPVELKMAPGTDHIRLVGTAGTHYNIRITVDSAREKAATIDLVNVILTTNKAAPVIVSESTQDLSISFFGSESGILGKSGDNGKNASLLKLSMNGEKGGDGELAIRTGGALRLIVSSDNAWIKGGNGGSGGNGMDAAPSPQGGGDGGRGGNGAQAIHSSSIDVYINKGYTQDSILIRGGYGGSGGRGGSKFLLGKDGANGADGVSATDTNVIPTYRK